MKIAQVVCVYPPYKGGMGNVAYNYFENLNKLGYDVVVYTSQYKIQKKDYKNSRIYYEKPLLSLGNGAFLPQLFFKLRKYDIVHLHYPFFGTAEIIWLQKFLSLAKFKLVIHFHMDTLRLSGRANFLSLPSKIIKSFLFNEAVAITCASIDYVENSSLSLIYKKYKNKFFEIPFGVNTKIFKPNDNNSSHNRVFFVSNLDQAHDFKGVDVLLKAFSLLNNKKAVLYIGGEGNLKNKYKKMSKFLGLSGRVKFLGNLSQDELVKNYQNASVTVLPSINSHEAFGLVLIESLACATPIIASNLPGVRSVFTDKIEGFKSKVGDYVDLAKKIDLIFLNNNSNKMGKKGLKLVKNKYSWYKSAQKLGDIYKAIV